MLSSSTFLILLVALVFVVVATPAPEPCYLEDHPGVISKVMHLLEPLLAEEEAFALKAKKAASSSSKKIVKVVSSTKKVKAAAKTASPTSAPLAVVTPSAPKSSPAPAVNHWSNTKPVVKKKAPVVKQPTKQTVSSGADQALGGFASSGLVSADVVKKLQEGEPSRAAIGGLH